MMPTDMYYRGVLEPSITTTYYYNRVLAPATCHLSVGVGYDAYR